MRLADQKGCIAAWTLRECWARFQIRFKATNPESARPAQKLAQAQNKSTLVRSAAPVLSDSAITDHVSQIRSKRAQINALVGDIDQSFKDTEQHLKNAKLPKEILARHTAAVALVQSRQAQFNKLMDKVEQADDKQQNKNKNSERQTALSFCVLLAFCGKIALI